MTVRAGFPHRVEEVENLWIPLPDGARLAARLWRPVDSGRVPGVLEAIPYRKRDGTAPRDALMHPYVAGHGYACLRVDLRGAGESDGVLDDEYSAQEMADILQVIGWLAGQDWCTGAVGMMGKSWGAFNCVQAAWNGHPALKAVIPVCGTVDRFTDDIHFKGGCLLGENFGWGAVMLSYMSRPPDPLLREDWRERWLERLTGQDWLAPRWAVHQARDGYWRHGSAGQDFSRIRVPALCWGGWADGYMNMPAAMVTEAAGAKGIIGPWVHQYPHTAVPGPQVGFLQMAIRWWDRWLKDLPNGAEADPAYRVFVQQSAVPDASAVTRAGDWMAYDAVPSAGTVLHLGMLAASAGGFTPGPRGYLGQDESRFRAEIASPQHLGMAAGEFFPMGLHAEMAGDQAGDDALSLCFDGEVLGAPLLLVGGAEVRLDLACDQPLGLVVARLCDVASDGSSVRIAHGMLNLCHRDGMDAPAAVVPGQAMAVRVPIDQMGYRLAAGHRLRLALSTGYWPFVWPSPRPVRLTVTGGALVLPVTAPGAPWSPPVSEHAPPFAHRVIRPPYASRRVEQDLITGTRALVVEDDQGEVENLTHGLVTAERMTERWQVHPDDPLSAIATHHWHQHLSRGDWQVRTEAWAEMTATATHLRMRARLTAWEGAAEVFRRDWDETVPRSFV